MIKSGVLITTILSILGVSIAMQIRNWLICPPKLFWHVTKRWPIRILNPLNKQLPWSIGKASPQIRAMVWRNRPPVKKSSDPVAEMVRLLTRMGELTKEHSRIMMSISVSLYVIGIYLLLIPLQVFAFNQPFDVLDRAAGLFSLVTFLCIFMVKSYLGPLLLGCTVAWTLNTWHVYGAAESLPLFQWVVVTLLAWAPAFIQQWYDVIFLLYALFETIRRYRASDPFTTIIYE